MRKLDVTEALRGGVSALLGSMVAGSRSMVGIALATATAGIIVGSVSLTGIGQVLAAVVETISMGYLPLVLVFTAIFALILGMGLPTTANYIIVSTLLAPIIYNIAGANGLAVPLVAVHLFCLYFGVMADATPPVALAAFAASGISGGDPFKTGIQGFFYEMRTAILPFVFLYNPEILLIGIQSPLHFVWVIFTAILACICFVSATQRYLLTHTRWWEVVLLVVAMILLFRPAILQDALYSPYEFRPASQVMAEVGKLKPGDNMRLLIRSSDGENVKERTLGFVAGEGNAVERMQKVGLHVHPEGEDLVIDIVDVRSRAESLGLDFMDDNRILGIDVPAERPDKHIFSIPGVVIFFGLYLLQRARRKHEEENYTAKPA